MENCRKSPIDKCWNGRDTNGGRVPGNPRLIIVNHVIYKYILNCQHFVIMYRRLVKSLNFLTVYI